MTSTRDWNIQKNDVGTQFRLTVKDGDNAVDISAATTITIKLKDPAGTTTSKSGSFYTDGSDGIVTYTTVDGDLASAGKWYIQAYVTDGTRSWHSSMESFDVHDNLS